MKQYVKRIAVAGVVLASVSTTSLFAQQGSTKEHKEVEQIIINRVLDNNTKKGDKVVIEIDGDKIKINGKDAKDLKDGAITVRKSRGHNAVTFPSIAATGQGWAFNMESDHISLFSENPSRAMLGVVTESDAKGAKISSVSEDAAAAKAGLKSGDIITKIGDQKIDATGDVTTAIRNHKPGDKVAVTVLRDGKEQKFDAVLTPWKGVSINALAGTRALSPDVWAPTVREPFRGTTVYTTGQPRMGLTIQDSEDGKGVKILEVAEDGNAAKAGLKKDDVITHVNDKAVTSTDEVTRILRENKDKASVMMKLQRNGKSQTIEVRTPKRLKTANL